MPSKTPDQSHFMNIAAHNPAFALKAGIQPSVAREFHQADKNKAAATGHRPLWQEWHPSVTKPTQNDKRK